MRWILLLTVASLLGAASGQTDERDAAWRVEKISLAPIAEGIRLLTASVVHAADDQRFELSDKVSLQEIHETFVWRDRLVLLGMAERTWVVEIFDLSRRGKLDHFVCGGPRRIREDWIAYTEFYFSGAQGPVVPNEVLLVYDLTKTPLENRLDREPGWKTPPPLDDYSDNIKHVGIPIFPESNAREKSYRITFETQNPGGFIDTAALAWLPSNKIVFKCSEQLPRMGAIGSRDYLVVVDLSRGLDAPEYKTVDIPRMGQYETRIERIEPDTPHTVRLVFPKGEYRDDSMVVALPEF
jgi:hypothetical protein